MDDECIHGLGPVAACVICNGRAAAEAQVPAETPVTMVAHHQATCPECGLPIHPGQKISWFPEHSRPTVHLECLDS